MPHPEPTDLDMTRHLDYFVWKDTSERVARRCDDTVDEKQVNSYVLKHLFFEGVELPKMSPKKPGNALSDALLILSFKKFAGWRRKKINFEFIILRSYFLHCKSTLISSNDPNKSILTSPTGRA